METADFECVFCKKKFAYSRSLRQHEIKFHNREKHGFSCSLCKCTVTGATYENHLIQNHEINLEKEQLTMTNNTEFLAWKNEVEKTSKSFYVCQSMKNSGEKLKTFFYCNRSGEYVTKGKRIRHTRIQGSRKIGARCPASITVTSNESGLHVLFIKTHVGHNMDLRHLNLQNRDRENLASDLALGLSKTNILQQVRVSWTEENTDRIHLTTKKDLTNIAHSFKIDSCVFRHSNDLVSVESWIDEMKTFKENPVILYNPPNENSDNFMLAISTSFQQNMFKKYAADVIAIDSTHGTNDYDFQLTTVMVVDENRVGFPVAFLYSSKVNAEVCTEFFRALKEKCGLIHTNTIMTDDFNGYYNAWQQIFGCENHLLCTWHILRAWEKHLNKIPLVSRSEIKADLSALQRQLDEEDFKEQLLFFLSKYKHKSDTKLFVEYFEKNYVYRPKQWAFCYRINQGINTNMHLENLHRNLKHVYMSGKKIKRLDHSLSILMKMLLNMQCERLIRCEKGFIPKKLQEVRERHKISLQCKYEVVQDSKIHNRFNVKSGNQIYYIHIIRQQECTCLLQCTECNICLNEVSCTCIDYSIKGVMCKHIHYVAMVFKNELLLDKQQIDESASYACPTSFLHQSSHSTTIKETDEVSLPGSSARITINDSGSDEVGTSKENSQFQDTEKLLELRKAKVTKNMLEAIHSCQTQEELSVVENFVRPILPTINAHRKNKTHKISAISGSQGTKKNIEHQRRFINKKKRNKKIPNVRESTLVNELNVSKQILTEHNYV